MKALSQALKTFLFSDCPCLDLGGPACTTRKGRFRSVCHARNPCAVGIFFALNVGTDLRIDRSIKLTFDHDPSAHR